MSTRIFRCVFFAVCLLFLKGAVESAWATLPTPNQPILVVQNSGSSEPYQNFVPELLLTEGLNGFQKAQLTDLTASFLANYDVVILPHLSLTAAQVTLFQNYVSAGGTLVGFRPDLQLANVFGVSSLGNSLSEGWLKIDTTTQYAKSLDSVVMRFHGAADLYSLNGASALATLYSNSTTATSSPAATIYTFGLGKAVMFSFDLTQSNVLMRQGNPAWAGSPNNHDGFNTLRASQMFVDKNSGQFWNDLGDGALYDVPQADIQLRLFSNALILSNAAKRPLPRLWYFPNQNRSMLLFTMDEHAFNSDLSNAISEINTIQSYGGKGSIFLWYPFGLISNSQVTSWVSAGHAIGVHFDDTAQADSSGVGGSGASWSGMQSVITSALNSFKTSYPSAPTPVTTRDHFVIWVSNNSAGAADQTAQAKLFQNSNAVQLDTSYVTFPNRWGYMSGSGLPMKFLDPATGAIIPVYQQLTQYEDDVQLSSYDYGLQWNLATAQSHYQKTLSDSLNKYNTVVTMLFHPDAWLTSWGSGYGPYSSYGTSVLQYAQANSIPMYSTAAWLQFWQGRVATALSMPSFAANTLNFSATGSPNGLTLLVPDASGSNVASTIKVDGASQSFTVASYQGVLYASVVLTAGTHSISVAYTTAGKISGQISPSAAAPSTMVQVQGGSITQSASVAVDGTYSVGPLPAGTYTVTPSSATYTFTPASQTITITANDVNNVNFTGSSAANFSLTVSPASQTTFRSSSTTYGLTINPIAGFAGQVTFNASGLPAGTTASFSPNPATSTTTLTLTTSASTPLGAFTVSVTGVNGSLTHSIPVSLTVIATGATFDSSVSSGIQFGVTTITTPAFTIGTGPSRAAMIMVAMGSNTATNITASLGGVAATLVPGTDSGTTATARTVILRVINPPSGSQTARVSWTGSMNADVSVIVATGVDQTTPVTNGAFAASNNSASAAQSVTITSATGDLTASIGYTLDSWKSPYTNRTLKWGIDDGEVGGDIGPGTGTTTHTWTDNYAFQNTAVSGANFRAAGSVPTYTISGTVTPTGAGATVTLSGGASATATADASGNYSFPNLVNGGYTVTPTKAGYTFNPTSTTLTVNGANLTANFTATANAYTISGTVTATGAGATVTLSGAASATATADALGNYSFPNLTNGSYTVTPTEAGFKFSPTSTTLTVSGANLTANFTATPVFTISGTVTATGAGATVTLSGAASATATADASGNYSFPNLVNGSYTITPTKTGYTFSPTSTTLAVSGANLTANFTATANAYTISGTVTATGAGATVTLSGAASATATADALGNYSFPNLTNGSYTVTPTEAGFKFSPTSTTLTVSGANLTANFTATPVFTISGTVTATGAGATVTLSGAASATATADASGNYSFPNLVNGSYTITPTKTGYVFGPTSTTLTVSGANLTANFTATPVFTISGTVTATGAGATVTLSGAASATATANASGNYSFPNLVNGSYTITPTKTGYVFSPTSTTLTVSGANLTANFTATPVFTISGTVTATGAGATVTLSGAASATATADASGNYSFPNLVNGSYTVTPSKTGYTFNPASTTLTVNGANMTANFAATAVGTSYTISGTVTATGAGATVTLSGAASATATADASGNYSFPNLVNGSYTITPTKTGYGFTPASSTVTVNGANVTVNFTAASTTGVQFDASTKSGFKWGVTTITTPAFTVGSGASRAAMIMVAMSGNTATNITASLGGVAGTLVAGSDTGTTATIRTMIFQVINPPSGSQTATVSWTGSMNGDVGVITVSGADQTTPVINGTFAASNNSLTTTESVTITSNAGDLTASIGFSADSWKTPYTNRTLKWGLDSAEVGGDIGPGTGTTTHTWTDTYQFQTLAVSGANFKAK